MFFSFWILFIVSCEPIEKPSSGFGELDGKVYIKNESNPVQGLGVCVSGNILDFTDSKGYFYLSKVPEGVQPLEVLYQMDVIYSTRVGIQSDKKTTVAIFLSAIKKDLPNFTAVDISNESEWDYWVVGKEEYFYIDEENSMPKSVFYHSFKNGKNYGITFDSKGLPSRVISGGFIFLFDNFNGNRVDVGLIFPSGEIRIAREVKTDFVWPTSTKSSQSKADVIRWTGRILGAIPCVTSGVTAFLSAGVTIPIALWTCGNYFLSMANNFFDDANVENGFTEFVDNYKLTMTVYNCTVNVDPTSCVIALATKGLNSYADYIEEMEMREDEIRIAEASLYAGYGDIQITLTWDNTSDLDLHVIDPFGEEIYWNHKFSESGGVLDYDDTDGYGPENIYWPKLQAPSGTYQVFVHDYVWTGKPNSANYIVLVTAFGKTKKFVGTINLDETVHIVDFDENGLKSTKNSVEISKITIESKK